MKGLRVFILLTTLSSTLNLVVGEEIVATNFCDSDICLCDLKLDPIEIRCNGLGLKSIYDEEDWTLTMSRNNISADRGIDLTFSDNEIEEIPRLPPLPIIYLSFANNQISRIDSRAFSNLRNLTILDLSHNKIDTDALIEDTFFGPADSDAEKGYFPLALTHLNLSHNNIHSIPKDSFDHLPDLTSLDLGYNPLRTMKGNTMQAMGYLHKLEYLGLRNTSISSVPEGTLHDMKQLRTLDLSYNLFSSVPKELSFTHDLEILNLDGNLLPKLGNDSFPDLGSLLELSISNMKTLRKVDQFAFRPLKKLNKLTMAHNPHLKIMDDGAFEGIIDDKEEIEQWPLKEVSMNDNGLTYFHAGLLPWDKLDYINIQNNPFRCDCNLGWMVLKLVSRLQLSSPEMVEDLTCAEPKDMKGIAISTLTNEPKKFEKCSSIKDMSNPLLEDVTPPQDNSVRVAGIVLLTIGTLLTVMSLTIVGFIVVKRRAIQAALMTPSHIRYERADTDDGSEWKYSQPSVHQSTTRY